MIKQCLLCLKDFSIPIARKDTAKYCSRVCADKAPREKNHVNCAECGKSFPLKKSQAERSKYWGNFCSKPCSSSFQSRMRSGENNPNFKNRNYCNDGYRLYTPQASLKLGFGKVKLHHAITFITLGINSIPSGYHVHHKDCDIMNNNEDNLQLISTSDHKWIHKEFGSATLWAFERGKIKLDDILSWSSDRLRAKFLLLSNISNQKDMLNGFDPKDLNHINDRLTMNKEYFNNLIESNCE